MPNRRHFMHVLATAIGGTSLAATTKSFALAAMQNVNPPDGCPALPHGGIPFAPGQDTRPIVARKPISAWSVTERTKLRRAFATLRALPPSDPRSWIRQANLHALYCRQCGNTMMQVHGSWSFLPWHRAYLYYYERILGSLVGDVNGFRLPYWEWEINRTLPQMYAFPANTTNVLWDAKRNAELRAGNSLPAFDATANRIDFLNDITDFTTFGGSTMIGGACEIDPHNLIHVDLGEQEPPWHDMGNLGFSARDPLFFAHHANCDKLWSRWNAAAGHVKAPAPAYRNPNDAAFLALRWSFYDENKRIVSISAGDILDHEQNLRYAYQISETTPARRRPLTITHHCKLVCCARAGVILEVSDYVRTQVLHAADHGSKVALVLPRVMIPNGIAGTFTIIAFRNGQQIPFGNAVIADDGLLLHGPRWSALALDATGVIASLLALSNPARIYTFSRYGTPPLALQTQIAELRIGEVSF